ncbi:MAG: hypothetical protein FJ137_17350 [Deltaproteobacteria bacterium]|nr:hypothetical protein [Deltaproteobacteria bacterium]
MTPRGTTLALLGGALAGALFGSAAQAQGDVATTLTAFCTHEVECVGGDATLQSCLDEQPDVEKAAGVDDDVCRGLADALLRHYQCQATLSCEALLGPAQDGCAATGAPLLDLLLTRGAGACFDGRPPVDAPPGWTCAAHYYNGGVADGCDCGCGVLDRDCENLGVVGCGDSGCTADGCEFCYQDGDNVSCDADPPPGPGPTPPRLPEPTAPASSCATGATGTTGGAGSVGVVLFTVFLRRRRRRALAGPSSVCCSRDER